MGSDINNNPNNFVLVLELLYEYRIRQWSDRAVYDQFFNSLSDSAHPRMGELLELLQELLHRRHT